MFVLAGMNFLRVGVGWCALFNGRYGSVGTFSGSVWVGMGGCKLFMSGRGLVWLGVGRSTK